MLKERLDEEINRVGLPDFLVEFCQNVGADEESVLGWYRDLVVRKVEDRGKSLPGKIDEVKSVALSKINTVQRSILEAKFVVWSALQERKLEGLEKKRRNAYEKGELKTERILSDLNRRVAKAESIVEAEPAIIGTILKKEKEVIESSEYAKHKASAVMGKAGYSGGVIGLGIASDIANSLVTVGEGLIRVGWIGTKEFVLGSAWFVSMILSAVDRKHMDFWFEREDNFKKMMVDHFGKFKRGWKSMTARYRQSLERNHGWMASSIHNYRKESL